MSQEIVYTSAPQGLKPGSRGFCTVVSTEGMAGNLADRLESHCGYRHAFGVNDDRRNNNPVNWSHTTMRVAGATFHVISRVADAGLDYSGRSSKLAHHLALDVAELPAAGPARTLQAPGVIRTEWSGEVGLLPRRKLPPVSIPIDYRATTWKAVTGDPGWAGVVAEKLLASPSPLSIIFKPGTDSIALVTELMDLIPINQRWGISFSTYFTQLAPGTECRLRFVLDDTPEATGLRKNPHAAVIDLVRDLPAPTGGELVQCAQQGQLPVYQLPSAPKKASQGPTAGDRVDPRRHAAGDDDLADDVWETEEDGEYAVQQHGDAAGGEARPAKRRRQKKRPGKLSKQFRWILMGCSIAAGLLLFVGVAVLVIPRLGSQQHAGREAVVADEEVSNLRQHRKNNRDAPKTNPRVNNGMDVAGLQGGIGERAPEQPQSQSASVESQNLASVVSGVKNGDLEKGHGPPTNEKSLAKKSDQAQNNDAGDSIPAQKPGMDPFASLPKDALNDRHAVLDLFANSTDAWNVVLNDDAPLKMELLGKPVFESAWKYELTPREDGKVRVWSLSMQLKDQIIELGDFRYDGAKATKQLSFHWSEGKRTSSEAEVLKYLALGLSNGKFARLCRLGIIPTKSSLLCKFEDEKKSDTEISVGLGQMLAQKLLEDRGLLINLELVGSIVDFSANEKRDTLHGMHSNERRPIPLTANTLLKRNSEWDVFKEDPVIAVLEIEPQISDSALNLKLAAFATISIFKESQFSTNSLDLPVPQKGKLPLVFDSLKILSPAPAKRLNESIEKRWSAERKRLMMDLERQSKSTPPPDPAKMELAKKAFEQNSTKLKADCENYQSRHKPEIFKWIWNALSGGAKGESRRNSILGAINDSKVRVQIVYGCDFAGQKHSIIVYEAGSK